MRIHVNGSEENTEFTTLGQYITENGYQATSLIAELNFKIIKQEEWFTTLLKEGDTIELLNFVGGG